MIIHSMCEYAQFLDVEFPADQVFIELDLDVWLTVNRKRVAVSMIVDDVKEHKRFRYPFDTDDLQTYIDELKALSKKLNYAYEYENTPWL